MLSYFFRYHFYVIIFFLLSFLCYHIFFVIIFMSSYFFIFCYHFLFPKNVTHSNDCSWHRCPPTCNVCSTCVWSLVCENGSTWEGALWRLFHLQRENAWTSTCGRAPCRNLGGSPCYIYRPERLFMHFPHASVFLISFGFQHYWFVLKTETY